jgi:hypothetical protein
MPQPSNRLDAGERVFFDTQLVAIDKRTYLQKYPEFKSRRLIPTIPDIPPWARGHRWTATTEVGKARLAASNATDVPVVDVNSTKNESLIHKYWLSYNYDDDEIRAAIATGIPLDAARAMACRRGVEQLVDEVLATGDAAVGSLGLFNQTDGTTVVASVKAVANDIMALAAGVASAMKDVSAKLTLLMPIDNYLYAAGTAYGNASDVSALKFAMSTMSDIIDGVESWWRCSTAGDGGGTVMLAYPRDENVLGGIVNQEYMVDAPIRGIQCEQRVGWMKCGGVIARYPYAIGKMHGI